MHAGAMLMAARDATEPPPLPTAPSGLTATALSGTTIKLDWTDNSDDELYFEIQYGVGDGLGSSGFPSTVTPVTADLETYNVTGLTGGLLYEFRIRAVNVTGNGAFSNIASATSLGDPPATPTNFSVLAEGAEGATAWWEDESGDEVNFTYEASEASDFDPVAYTGTTAANVETADVTNVSQLDAGETWYFRLRAFKASGAASAYTATATIIIQSGETLSAPTSPGATVDSGSQITIGWTDVSGGTDATQVQRAEDSGFTTGVRTSQIAAGTTTAVFTGLVSGTTYYFRGRTYDVATGAYSAWFATVTAVAGVPPAPADLAVTDQQTDQITFTWTDPPNSDLTELDVEIDTDSGFGSPTQDTVSVGTETKTFTSLTEGTVYYVRVRGVNDAGDGSWSSATTGTQLATPTSLAEADFGSFWTLTWTDNSAGESGYEIHKDTGGGYALFDTLAADTETYDVLKAAGVTWKVRAVHATLPDSDYSNEFADPT